jgi:hypothetical protein
MKVHIITVLIIMFIISVFSFALGHNAGYDAGRAMFAEEAILCSQDLDNALAQIITQCYEKCYACGHIVEHGFNITRLD